MHCFPTSCEFNRIRPFAQNGDAGCCCSTVQALRLLHIKWPPVIPWNVKFQTAPSDLHVCTLKEGTEWSRICIDKVDGAERDLLRVGTNRRFNSDYFKELVNWLVQCTEKLGDCVEKLFTCHVRKIMEKNISEKICVTIWNQAVRFVYSVETSRG